MRAFTKKFFKVTILSLTGEEQNQAEKEYALDQPIDDNPKCPKKWVARLILLNQNLHQFSLSFSRKESLIFIDFKFGNGMSLIFSHFSKLVYDGLSLLSASLSVWLTLLEFCTSGSLRLFVDIRYHLIFLELVTIIPLLSVLFYWSRTYTHAPIRKLIIIILNFILVLNILWRFSSGLASQGNSVFEWTFIWFISACVIETVFVMMTFGIIRSLMGREHIFGIKWKIGSFHNVYFDILIQTLMKCSALF